ncbi:class I SAM-dependent methyltransferase [Legionella nagasakiensis]|uniref:class I SAM-dependent methyltransferase n=1 Tax=Legionella nagasakiensis TaxID=535290 RepID=UPI001054BCFC|nr:class I SAM-dependent methyltransferase [Legionella nagasakiensis]
MMNTKKQIVIDQENQLFWNELCGTQLAKELGVVDSSQDSLSKFDNFYMDFYPYLEKHLFLDEIKEKNVLEVGLGYGTISQKLALTGANYYGLDIAPNAVAMARHRLEQHGITGDIRTGSMLECPFPDNYFDYVFSIGCFHHTGDMQACVDETYRVLKDGGKAVIMVYNKFSLRLWMKWPKWTAKNFMFQFLGKNIHANEEHRKAYDTSSSNNGAPETEFFSIREIRRIFKRYHSVKTTRENFDEDVALTVGKLPIYRFKKRAQCLDNKWARYFGLDLYIHAVK